MARLAILVGASAVIAQSSARAQEPTYYAQAPRSARHVGALRRAYPEVERLLNAFDYGHAIAYEVLLRSPNGSVRRLEEDEFGFITRTLLERAPRFPIIEAAVAPTYAREARELRLMFEWSHYLHRELWDIWADPRLSPSQREAEMRKAVAYYRSRRDLAFSAVPKSSALMHDQPFSHAFRRTHPKFSGLLWSYHWLQLALHEALLDAVPGDARDAKVAAVVARFRELVGDSAVLDIAEMPIAPLAAPRFSARYPEAAAIFDNMHAMHDVVADAFAANTLAPAARRVRLKEVAEQYRNSSTAILTIEEWKAGRDGGSKHQGEGHGSTVSP